MLKRHFYNGAKGESGVFDFILSAFLIGRRDPGNGVHRAFPREHVILFETKLKSVCGVFLGVGGGMGHKDLSFLKAYDSGREKAGAAE
jgi:hypothetical protein